MKSPWVRRFAYNGRRYRAADDVTLGALELPAPGAPEPLSSNYVAIGDCGCGCKGKGTCGKGMSGVKDWKSMGGSVSWKNLGDVSLSSPLVLVGAGLAAYFLFFRKK